MADDPGCRVLEGASTIVFESYRSNGDLVRAAAGWLDVHPDATILGLNVHDTGEGPALLLIVENTDV